MGPRRWVLGAVWGVLTVVTLLSVVGIGCRMDEQVIYFPEPWAESVDWGAEWGLPLEEVWFQADDGTRLFGWFVQGAPDVEPAPAVMLWCHGNAGNITHRLENIAELHRRGVSLFIFDYRGYGRSEGRPTEEGLYLDALAAYDVLTRQRGIPADQLVLFGRSLGASVAGELALQRPVAGIILETPMTSIADMARAHYGGLPFHHLVKARYDLRTRVPKLRAPVMVIHGDRDTLVPTHMGRELYDMAADPKEWYLIPGAEHNDTYVVGGDGYFDRILDFLRRCARRGAPSAEHE